MLSFAQHPKLFYSLILVEAFFFSSCGLNLYTNGLSASAIAKTLVLSGPSSASGAACAGSVFMRRTPVLTKAREILRCKVAYSITDRAMGNIFKM